MLNYSGTTFGYLTIKQNNRKYKVDIREANCLCAFIHIRKATKEELKKYGPNGKYIHTLYSFFQDAQHMKNIMKDNNGKLFWDEVVKLELNTFYRNLSPCSNISLKLGTRLNATTKTKPLKRTSNHDKED